MYIIRLDDASEYMNVEKWINMERLLDKYSIAPLVGIIPENKDPELLKYQYDSEFWNRVLKWKEKDWELALHGCNHVFHTDCGGINPVNQKSEFAGLSLVKQREKIKNGLKILNNQGVFPKIFFAPAHTFDLNTIEALKCESNIRIISDTVANNVYKFNDMFFIPQQSGKVRNLPFKVTTFCYHPNEMTTDDFEDLEKFLKKNYKSFGRINSDLVTNRKKNFYDILLSKAYFRARKIRKMIKRRVK